MSSSARARYIYIYIYIGRGGEGIKGEHVFISKGKVYIYIYIGRGGEGIRGEHVFINKGKVERYIYREGRGGYQEHAPLHLTMVTTTVCTLKSIYLYFEPLE